MCEQNIRINRLRNSLDNKQALLITNENNIYYYSDFYKSEGAMLITEDEAYLLVDFRYYESALNLAKGCKVIQFKILTDSVQEILKSNEIKSLLIESDDVNITTYTKYIRVFNEIGVSIESDGALDRAIKNQRIIKSAKEIEFISYAQKITEKAYLQILNYIKPGVTEREISLELEYLLKKQGAQDISFDLITITGKKTSLPHGVPGDNVISEGDFFTLDIGSLYCGYHSDMTRTVAVKNYSEDMKNIYDIVLNAQFSALQSVSGGVKARDVDKVARDIINKAGYGECFGHSTGHGVGLDIHEAPNVSPNSETLLSEGMVITVEPGIYLQNQFGVRIEDMVLVKDNGYKNFVTISKELIVV